MKKTIFIFIVMILFYIIIGNAIATSNLIPDDAIRIRIIANSNSDYDQQIKIKVKEQVEKDIYNMLENIKEIEEARKIISANLGYIEESVDRILQKEAYKLPFRVDFGLNYFPQKEFKGIVYDEGYYESIVITLGSGLGDNWWCVLFPPLCTLEAEDSTEVEYTTLVKEMLDKYF